MQSQLGRVLRSSAGIGVQEYRATHLPLRCQRASRTLHEIRREPLHCVCHGPRARAGL